MRKLLPFTTLLLLLSSCAGSSLPTAVPEPSSRCRVPELPDPPDIHPGACDSGEDVCLSIKDTLELSEWVHRVREVKLALDRCPTLERI